MDEKKQQRKRWIRQEKQAARKLSGRRTPGSGNKWHSPGDVKSSKFLVSCKTTSSASFSITDKVVKELVEDAFFEDKIPVLHVTVNDKEKPPLRRSFWIFLDQNVEFDGSDFKVS